MSYAGQKTWVTRMLEVECWMSGLIDGLEVLFLWAVVERSKPSLMRECVLRPTSPIPNSSAVRFLGK